MPNKIKIQPYKDMLTYWVHLDEWLSMKAWWNVMDRYFPSKLDKDEFDIKFAEELNKVKQNMLSTIKKWLHSIFHSDCYTKHDIEVWKNAFEELNEGYDTLQMEIENLKLQVIELTKDLQDTNMEQKSYFTIAELTASSTATANKIDNTPTPEITKHIEELIKFLNPMREAWGSGININSGYRCETLNKAVGGASTSGHLTGYAVDMVPSNGKFGDFKTFIIKYLKDNDIKFDECIIEKNSKGSEWVHFSLYSIQGLQRMKQFDLNVK